MNRIINASIIFFVLLFGNVALAQSNLLNINPGFELGKKGWYYSSKSPNYIFVIDDLHEGSQSLKMSSQSGQGVTFIYTNPAEQKLTIEKNKKYRLDVWIKPLTKSNGVVFRVYPVVGGFRPGTDIEINRPAKLLKQKEWQLLSFDFAGIDYPAAKCSFGVNLGDYLLDEIKLYEVH